MLRAIGWVFMMSAVVAGVFVGFCVMLWAQLVELMRNEDIMSFEEDLDD